VTYHYRAYGVTCLSDTPIDGFFPEYASPSFSPDLLVELNPDPPEWVRAARDLPAYPLYHKPPALDPSDSSYKFSRLGSDQFFELTYSDGTEFVIDASGERLWGRCQPPHSIDYLATYLRGPVMGFILRRRGVIALHASAISLFGQAIVLCGETQSGKSTTAAALALRGAPVLCDDVTPLRLVGGGFCTEPGYAHVGLWPDAVQKLLGASDALPRWTPTWEKCFLPLDGKLAEFAHHSQSLAAIYLLGPRTNQVHAPRIERVERREGLLHLVQNTYMNWLLDRTQRAAEFDLLSKLVMHVPVRRVVPHCDAAHIPAICDLIARDVKELLMNNENQPLAANSLRVFSS
jgi:hypothetical protein